MLVDIEKGHLLVTGGAGFMGSAFIRFVLQKTNFSGLLINLDLLTYAANLENLSSVQNDPRYRFFKGNINEKAILEQIHGEYHLDGIIHFAAETHVDRSIKSPEVFIQTNILGTYQLLEFVRSHPSIHFHHISTDEVYGSLKEEGIFTEQSPYAPNSPYSASKASSDHLVRSFGETYDLSITLSHASNNYGPYQFPEKFIPLMILNCIEEKSLPLYGTGKNIRNWLYVEDHAEAVWNILEKGKAKEVYNIGGTCELSNLDLLHSIILLYAEISGKKQEELTSLITFISDRPGHDFRYAIDGSKMNREIGWKAKNSLLDGLKKTIQWYLTHPYVKTGDYVNWIQIQYAGEAT